jgi:toxin CcdB
MAQFDVIALKSGDWVIDCQANLFQALSTRFVVPLSRLAEAPPLRPHLNPIFEIAGEQRAMITQFAGAASISELAGKVGSLGEEEYIIKNALDLLLSGV